MNSEKFQTFPIKIISKESSNSFYFVAERNESFSSHFVIMKKLFFLLLLLFFPSRFHIIAPNRVISERKRKAQKAEDRKGKFAGILPHSI
jgi:hypothetical protein